jgi:hypothetical protein
MSNSGEFLLRDDHEDDCSCVSEPPFALEGTEYGDQGPHKHIEYDDSVSITKQKSSWSAVTEKTAPNSSMFSQSPLRDDHPDFSSPDIPIHDGSEQIEFDAAASLLASDSMLNSSSFLQTISLESRVMDKHPGQASLNFSQLMRQADDQHVPVNRSAYSPLPTLPEYHEMNNSPEPTPGNSSVLTPRTTNKSWTPNERLTLPNDRFLDVVQESEDVFRVFMKLSPSCTTRDVMGIIGNPDLLRLWCEPIQSLIVTKCSEGARSATNRHGETGDRVVSSSFLGVFTKIMLSLTGLARSTRENGWKLQQLCGRPPKVASIRSVVYCGRLLAFRCFPR